MATVFAKADFNASNDAEALENAMQGLGTDEQAIINILGYRTVAERQLIAKMYKASYGRDLLDRIGKELSGRFRDIVIQSFRDKAHLQAKALYDAMKGAGTKERVIISTICTMTNQEIADLKDAYKDILIEEHENLLRRDIEKDICNDLGGDFKHLIVALLQGVREEGVDTQSAEADAESLFAAGEKNGTEAGETDVEWLPKWVQSPRHPKKSTLNWKLGTDESVFTKIFVRRSFDQIRLLDELYFKKAEHGLLKAIKNELSGDYGKAIKTIKTIADLIRDTMKGAGTDDEELIRLVLAYSEDNLAEVKNIFEEKNGKSLENWIRDDTSGDYRNFLLAIVDNM